MGVTGARAGIIVTACRRVMTVLVPPEGSDRIAKWDRGSPLIGLDSGGPAVVGPEAL